MAILDRFVGLPWEDRGRSYEGCDCYGLAFLIYRDLLGVELPLLSDRYSNTADAAAIADIMSGARPLWIPIAAEEAKPYDVVMLRERPWHMGIVSRPGWMLHMPFEQTSVNEQYTTGRHWPRVEGLYRHPSRI